MLSCITTGTRPSRIEFSAASDSDSANFRDSDSNASEICDLDDLEKYLQSKPHNSEGRESSNTEG
jgi:hypothetical protein